MLLSSQRFSSKTFASLLLTQNVAILQVLFVNGVEQVQLFMLWVFFSVEPFVKKKKNLWLHLWQAREWIQAISVTYAPTVAMLDPLTHCSGLGIEPTPLCDLRHCNVILNTLYHSRNSEVRVLKLWFICSHLVAPWST